MPLEEVLDINVRRSSNTAFASYGINVFEGRALKQLSKNLRLTHQQTSRNEQHSWRLLIDGYYVGEVESVRDLKSYIKYLRHSITRLETYSGRSARWLGAKGDHQPVINLVTKQKEVP